MKANYSGRILMTTGAILAMIGLFLLNSGCSSDGGERNSSGTATVTDIETYDLDETADGWIIVDPTGNGFDCATVFITQDPVYSGTGAVEFYYSIATQKFPVLYNTTARTTELVSIGFFLRSMNNASLLMILYDRDGAQFYYTIEVVSGSWTEVSLTPWDFEPDNSAAVVKDAIDPERLKPGFALFDMAPATGGGGNNTLWIDALRIQREPLILKTGEWLIDGTAEMVNESMVVEGNVRIINNGSLTATCPRFVLKGDIVTESGGAFETSDVMLEIPQEYRWQYCLLAGNGGDIGLVETDIYTAHPLMLMGNSGAGLNLDRVDMCLCGFHVEVINGCTFDIKNCASVGEICLFPGVAVNIENTDVVLVWFFAVPGVNAAICLPDGTSIADWQLDSELGIDLSVSNSTNVLWGLISYPGSVLRIDNSEILVTGLLFSLNSIVPLTGIENGKSLDNSTVFTDRILELENSPVNTWNFYASGNAAVLIDNCLFGEALSFDTSSIEISNSTCDGTGGYLGSEDESEIYIVDTKVTCEVLAFGSSELIIENSSVTGNIMAVDSSTIRIRNIAHKGLKLEFDQGIIIEE